MLCMSQIILFVLINARWITVKMMFSSALLFECAQNALRWQWLVLYVSFWVCWRWCFEVGRDHNVKMKDLTRSFFFLTFISFFSVCIFGPSLSKEVFDWFGIDDFIFERNNAMMMMILSLSENCWLHLITSKKYERKYCLAWVSRSLSNIDIRWTAIKSHYNRIIKAKSDDRYC